MMDVELGRAHGSQCERGYTHTCIETSDVANVACAQREHGPGGRSRANAGWMRRKDRREEGMCTSADREPCTPAQELATHSYHGRTGGQEACPGWSDVLLDS